MKLLPADDVSRYQFFLLLFLVSILSSTFINSMAFAAMLVIFGVLCLFLTQAFPPAQKKQAYALFCVFALFGAAVLFGNQLVSSPVQALSVMPFFVLGFLALYVIVKLYVVSWEAECTVIGYSEGYAIVDVAPAILSVVTPGIHAVKSRPVAKGRKARLVFDRKLFGSASKPAGLETHS